MICFLLIRRWESGWSNCPSTGVLNCSDTGLHGRLLSNSFLLFVDLETITCHQLSYDAVYLGSLYGVDVDRHPVQCLFSILQVPDKQVYHFKAQVTLFFALA